MNKRTAPVKNPYFFIICADCGRKRRNTAFFTASGAHTKVCSYCRVEHKRKVKLAKGATTTLSSTPMQGSITCEKCGLPVPLREMLQHRKECWKIEFGDIPNLAPEGQLAEMSRKRKKKTK